MQTVSEARRIGQRVGIVVLTAAPVAALWLSALNAKHRDVRYTVPFSV